MRFNSFLIEETAMDEVSRNLLQDLEAHCGYYKSICKSILYRGSDSAEGKESILYREKIPRQDRKPMNTGPAIHKALNDFFEREWGWRARSQGVFATGNWQQATIYGHVSVFVPIGKFEYLWSPKVRDLYMKVDYYDLEEDGSLSQRFIKEYGNTYTDDNLKKAAGANVEIMVKCERYYQIGYALKDIVQGWLEQ